MSLNLHIKLKHNGGNKTEREKLAVIISTQSLKEVNIFHSLIKRTIFLAKINGEDVPEINLNLPPGFLDVNELLFES